MYLQFVVEEKKSSNQELYSIQTAVGIFFTMICIIIKIKVMIKADGWIIILRFGDLCNLL